MNKYITVVFFGRSGSGKGTQAGLLIDRLKNMNGEIKTVYVETGDRFRNFIKESGTYTADRVKEVMAEGGLMPAFIPIWTWTSLLIDEVKGKEHLIFDGVSRRPDEAPILDSALRFYDRQKPFIIVLDVPEIEVTDRLLKRGRNDDKPEKIQERLKWFETDVVPAISYFESHPYYTCVHINGDQPIEKVHADIVKVLEI